MTVRLEHALGATYERSAFELVSTNFRAGPAPVWDTSAIAPSYSLTDASPAQASPWRGAGAGPAGGAAGQPSRAPGRLAAAPGRHAPRGAARRQCRDRPRPGRSGRASPAVARHGARRPRCSPPSRRPPGPRRRPARSRRGCTPVTERAGRYQRPARWCWPRARARRRSRSSCSWRCSARRTSPPGASGAWSAPGAAGNAGWAEAWTGTWRPLDPTLTPGDPVARLRLATGGEARFLDLALRAGRLRLTALHETP